MAAADEKVRLTTQHIVRTLATSKNAADDMIRILSGFDDRFSDLFPSSAASGGAAAGDDRPATSGEESPAIGRDQTKEMSGSPMKGCEKSSLTAVQEVNDGGDVSEEISVEERHGISEEDSVGLDETHSLAKSKLPDQLDELAELEKSAIIEVISPYITGFDDNFSSDLHPHNKAVVLKLCEELERDLTSIAEGAAHKIKLAWTSVFMCEKIKEMIESLDKEEDCGSLTLGTPDTVKVFNAQLLSILKRLLARYDKETEASDSNIREDYKAKLEKFIVQILEPAFTTKVESLCSEIHSLAKSKLPDQLDELAELEKSAIIEVISPYITRFDDNFCSDLHPHNKAIVLKLREELQRDLTSIAEEEARKIKDQRIPGSGSRFGSMDSPVSPAREEPPSYLQRYEPFENPMAGPGAQTSGSRDDDERSSSNPIFGRALYDFLTDGDDELSLVAGEEVEIDYEVDGWYYVKKKRPGRDGKMAGLVPVLYVSLL